MTFRTKTGDTVVSILLFAIFFNISCAAQQLEDPRIAEYNACAIEKINLMEYDAALKEITKIIQLHPDEPVAYLDRGIIKNDFLRHHMGAIHDFSKAIEIDSLNIDAYYLRGISRYSLKKYKEALKDFIKVTTLEAENADVYYYKGLAEVALKDFKAALNDYTTAIAIRRDHAKAYGNRAMILAMQQHDYPSALDDCNRAIATEPDDPSNYYTRGWIKAELSDVKGAIEDYRRAIKLDPQYDNVYDTTAAIKHNLKDYSAALRLYSKIAANEKTDTAYFRRGILNMYLQDYKAAIRDFDKALLLNSNNAEAYYKRGYSKAQLKEYAGAIADYATAISTVFKANENSASGAPLLEKAYMRMAELNFLNANYKAAQIDYDTLIRLHPYTADYYLQRGKLKIMLNEKTDACLDFKNYAELSGNHPPELETCR